jgi:hypothetical protein
MSDDTEALAEIHDVLAQKGWNYNAAELAGDDLADWLRDHDAALVQQAEARGREQAEQVFDAMFYDPDWDGQVSMGFAATFSQNLGEGSPLLAQAEAQSVAREKALRERVERLADSIEGDSGVAHNYGCQGEPDCLACIVADLRALLAADGGEEG